jgi:hypothetical protein
MARPPPVFFVMRTNTERIAPPKKNGHVFFAGFRD